MSRAYSFWNPEDRIHIARMFALLTTAKPHLLLQQWVPPIRSAIDPCEVGATDEAATEEWEWLTGWPRVIASRAELWGSRAVMLRGKARLVSSSSRMCAERRARLDVHGVEDDVFTMQKCQILPARIRGHELSMQHHLAALPTTPKPIDLLRLDDSARVDTTCHTGQHGQGTKPLSLQVLVYQHKYGSIISYKLPETWLCKLWYDITAELRTYSEIGAHYRDLNSGNLMYELLEDGSPRAFLIDHGNMRLSLQRRGDLSGKEVPRSLWNDLRAVAQDDARSANPLLLPTSMHYIEAALKTLREAGDHPGNPSLTPCSAPENARREEREEIYEAEYHLLVYSHTYIDDLESACYLLLWHGVSRSFSSDRERYKKLDGLLRDLADKCTRWERRGQWRRLLARYCTAMSAAWHAMIIELNDIIASAQRERRKRLNEKVIKPLKDCQKAADELDALRQERLEALQAAIAAVTSEAKASSEGNDGLSRDEIVTQYDELDSQYRTEREALKKRKSGYMRAALELLNFSDDDNQCFEDCKAVYRKFLDQPSSDQSDIRMSAKEFDSSNFFPAAGDMAEKGYDESQWNLGKPLATLLAKRKAPDQNDVQGESLGDIEQKIEAWRDDGSSRSIRTEAKGRQCEAAVEHH